MSVSACVLEFILSLSVGVGVIQAYYSLSCCGDLYTSIEAVSTFTW